MSLSTEIERLEQLRSNGTLSEDEFRQAKARVIHGETDLDHHESTVIDANADKIHGFETNLWCAAMHLTQLLTVFAGAGTIIPIVMWVMSKDQSREADRHGVIITNWIITSIIYLVASFLLTPLLIGIPLLIATAAAMIVFPIIGGLKALSGDSWEYPLSIHFFSLPYDDYAASYDDMGDHAN